MKQTQSLKFGFITDTHFSVIRNNFRTDDYFKSILSKFQQCYRWLESNQAEFVIHGGDMFDKYRSYSHPMVRAVRKVIVNAPFTTYYIWGQHDLLGYNRESGKGSNLSFLDGICDGKLVEITDRIDLPKCHLFASHVDMDAQERLSFIPKNLRKPAIAVAHALLYDGGKGFGTINVHGLKEVHADVVLSGDLHCGFDRVDADGTVYYNPGSLARTSREERKPKCALIEMSPFMGGWDVQIEEFFPECDEYPFPEQQEEIKVEVKPQDSEEYIEAFEKFKSETKDIYERLEKAGGELGIDKEVLEYIKSRKE